MGKASRLRSRERSTSVTARAGGPALSLHSSAGPGTGAPDRPVARLGLNRRGFYRDIELLRAVGIRVRPDEGRYTVTPGFDAAVNLLPFPDPQLSLGDAQRLAPATPPPIAFRRRVEQITQSKGKAR